MFKQQKECIHSNEGQGSSFKHITCCMHSGSSSSKIQQQQLHLTLSLLSQIKLKALSKTSRCIDAHLTSTKALSMQPWYVQIKINILLLLLKVFIVVRSNHRFVGLMRKGNELYQKRSSYRCYIAQYTVQHVKMPCLGGKLREGHYGAFTPCSQIWKLPSGRSDARWRDFWIGLHLW